MYAFHGQLPRFIVVISFAITPLWSGSAHAQSRAPLTMAEAEDLALANEPGGIALLSRADAMREQAVAAAQLPDPKLRLGLANYPLGGGGFSTEGMTQAQLGVRQSFPRAREFDAARIRAQADAFAQSANERNRDVLTATRTAWLDAYYSQRAWETVELSRPFLSDLVTVTRSLYAVGRKSQHDVLRAELELSRLDDRLLEADRLRAAAQAELSRWLGFDAYRPVADKLPAWEALPDKEELRARLIEHPATAVADADVSASEAAVRIAEENRKPGWVLDLGYGYREGFLPSGEPRSDFISLSVTVDLPLFSKNRQDRKLSAALSERRAAVNSRAELQARLVSELDLEYARWKDLTRRRDLYEDRILDMSRAQVDAAMTAYQNDAGDFADVMRAYVDDLDTRLTHVRLQVERAQSYATLANLGGLD